MGSTRNLHIGAHTAFTEACQVGAGSERTMTLTGWMASSNEARDRAICTLFIQPQSHWQMF